MKEKLEKLIAEFEKEVPVLNTERDHYLSIDKNDIAALAVVERRGLERLIKALKILNEASVAKESFYCANIYKELDKCDEQYEACRKAEGYGK